MRSINRPTDARAAIHQNAAAAYHLCYDVHSPIILPLISSTRLWFPQNNDIKIICLLKVIFCYLAEIWVNRPFLLFLLLMCPLSVPNERWSVLAAGSNCLEPSSRGVIRETGRSIWLHDWHRLMIMGCNSTLLRSTNHTGLAWTALNANEPWLEYWAAARPRSSTPFTPRGIRHMIMAVTLHHLQHCHYCHHG